MLISPPDVNGTRAFHKEPGKKEKRFTGFFVSFLSIVLLLGSSVSKAGPDWPEAFEELQALLQSRLRYKESLLEEQLELTQAPNAKEIVDLEKSADLGANVKRETLVSMALQLRDLADGQDKTNAERERMFYHMGLANSITANQIRVYKKLRDLLSKLEDIDLSEPQKETQKKVDFLYFVSGSLSQGRKSNIDNYALMDQINEERAFSKMFETLRPFATACLQKFLQEKITAGPITCCSQFVFNIPKEWPGISDSIGELESLKQQLKPQEAEKKLISAEAKEAFSSASSKLEQLKSTAKKITKKYAEAQQILAKLKIIDLPEVCYSPSIIGCGQFGGNFETEFKDVFLPSIVAWRNFEAELPQIHQEITETFNIYARELSELRARQLLQETTPQPPKAPKKKAQKAPDNVKEQGALEPAASLREESQAQAAPLPASSMKETVTLQLPAAASEEPRAPIPAKGSCPAPSKKAGVKLPSRVIDVKARAASASPKVEVPDWMENFYKAAQVDFNDVLTSMSKHFGKYDFSIPEQNAVSFRSPINEKLIHIFFHKPHGIQLRKSWPAWRINFRKAFKEAGY